MPPVNEAHFPFRVQEENTERSPSGAPDFAASLLVTKLQPIHIQIR